MCNDSRLNFIRYFTEMKRTKVNKWHLWNFYVFPLVFAVVTCYPTAKPDLEAQPELRDEKHFPNGTVVGKYTYMDNEGNPIQVKYYADDASYGVELKSIKVVDSTGEPLSSAAQYESSQNMQNAQLVQSIPTKYDYNAIKSTDSDMKLPSELASNHFPTMSLKYKNSDPYDFLNKDVGKLSRYKVEKSSPDYEIYYQNELKGPKKCTKEKVRVYFDKENRKIRSAINDNLEADKFCEQF